MKQEIRVAETQADLQLFLDATIESSGFEIQQINISEQDQWHFNYGNLTHVSGGFFHVNGLKNRSNDQESLILYQPQSALTGLALCKSDGVFYVLLQARVEPGNSGIGQYGPTVQSTAANYLRLHGGRQTTCLNWFNSYTPDVRPIGRSMQFDLGTRYYLKSKFHDYVELPNLVPTEGNMIWASLSAVTQSVSCDNFLNTDLRSLLGIFDWGKFAKGDASNNELNRSLIGNAFYSDLMLGKQDSVDVWQLASLTELDRWEITDKGIADVGGSGVTVPMFRTFCKSREVDSWVQPLMRVQTRGLVQLVMRENEGDLEFLVTLDRERGMAGQVTVLPSCVVYPESVTRNTFDGSGKVLVEYIQSEEGGRFYQMESIQQLILVTEELDTADNQYWISSQILKKLLGTSNMVSIQLRCMASILIERLHAIG